MKVISNIVTVLFFLLLFEQSKAQITDTTIFPLNEYLTTGVKPYPVLIQSKINSINNATFVNVMTYGAQGDGVTLDDDAIKNAFNAAMSASTGVLFPTGHTFLVSKLTTIRLNHNMTVWAYGATIKMKALTKNSWLSLAAQRCGYHYRVIWLGGTLDGNQYNQSWPGNPHGGIYDGGFSEAHGRFLGAEHVTFALFKDVQIINTVVDGIGIESSNIGVIANCHADNGAPLVYTQVGEQGTYFKVTRVGLKAAYFINDTSLNGSIGTHVSYPTNAAMDTQTVSVHLNCYYKNQVQDADHIEDCYKNFYYNCTLISDSGFQYHQVIHISNKTGIVSIRKSAFTNSRVDFNNATALKLAIIDSSDFVSTFLSVASPRLTYFIEGRPTLVYQCTFTGRVATNQAELKNVRKSTFTNFDSLAISSGYAIDSCTFNNGYKPATLGFQGFVIHPTYISVGYTTYPSLPPPNWELVFGSYINIINSSGGFLGKISLY